MLVLLSFFTYLKGQPAGIEFIDPTSLKRCHNLHTPLHHSVHYFILDLRGELIAYCLKLGKPSLKLTSIEK